MKFLVKMLFSFNFHAGLSCTTKTKISIDSLIKKNSLWKKNSKNTLRVKTLTLRVMKTG